MIIRNVFVKPAMIAGVMLLTACGGADIDGAALAAEKGCVACHGVKEGHRPDVPKPQRTVGKISAQAVGCLSRRFSQKRNYVDSSAEPER